MPGAVYRFLFPGPDLCKISAPHLPREQGLAMNRLITALVALAFIVSAGNSALAGTEAGSSLSFNVTNLKNDRGKLVMKLESMGAEIPEVGSES